MSHEHGAKAKDLHPVALKPRKKFLMLTSSKSLGQKGLVLPTDINTSQKATSRPLATAVACDVFLGVSHTSGHSAGSTGLFSHFCLPGRVGQPQPPQHDQLVPRLKEKIKATSSGAQRRVSMGVLQYERIQTGWKNASKTFF